MNYIQCEIVRDGFLEVAWLPKIFAVEGKLLNITGVEGYRVARVYRETEMPYEVLNDNSRDYLRTRKASDI